MPQIEAFNFRQSFFSTGVISKIRHWNVIAFRKRIMHKMINYWLSANFCWHTTNTSFKCFISFEWLFTLEMRHQRDSSLCSIAIEHLSFYSTLILDSSCINALSFLLYSSPFPVILNWMTLRKQEIALWEKTTSFAHVQRERVGK